MKKKKTKPGTIRAGSGRLLPAKNGDVCNMCGKCCYYEIPLTLLDIHRFARYLGLPDRPGR